MKLITQTPPSNNGTHDAFHEERLRRMYERSMESRGAVALGIVLIGMIISLAGAVVAWVLWQIT